MLDRVNMKLGGRTELEWGQKEERNLMSGVSDYYQLSCHHYPYPQPFVALSFGESHVTVGVSEVLGRG